jgi:hypothetical protein
MAKKLDPKDVAADREQAAKEYRAAQQAALDPPPNDKARER